MRRHHLYTVSFFVALTLLVAGERRLAETHFNLFDFGQGIENRDSVDRDEIRVRLLLLNDDRPPALPVAAGGVEERSVAFVAYRIWIEPLGPSEPRAPPRPPASAA